MPCVRVCKCVCAHLTKKSIEFSLIHIFTNSSKILMFLVANLEFVYAFYRCIKYVRLSFKIN